MCRFFRYFLHSQPHLVSPSNMDFKNRSAYTKIRESYVCFVTNKAITNNSKYILVTYNHYLTCTQLAFIPSIKINIFIIQPYAVKFFRHLVFSFSRENFSIPEGKQLKQNWTKVHVQCDAAKCSMELLCQQCLGSQAECSVLSVSI